MTALRSWRRLDRDRIGALLMLVVGLGIVAEATTYRRGTLTQMGPGFVPLVLGILLVLVAVAIAFTAVVDEANDRTEAPRGRSGWRGWLCILGGVVAFVVLGKHGGLVPASFATVFVSALGDRGNSVRDAFLLAAGLTLAGVLIFGYALHLQLPLFTWG